VDVDAIVARVWPGRRAAIEVIGGRITNDNYKVTFDGDVYVYVLRYIAPRTWTRVACHRPGMKGSQQDLTPPASTTHTYDPLGRPAHRHPAHRQDIASLHEPSFVKHYKAGHQRQNFSTTCRRSTSRLSP
jgi:hypothetical protein